MYAIRSYYATSEFRVDLATPVFGQNADITPRNWTPTWAYNIGGHFQINNTWALNVGYLYGENAVPDSTFDPLIPDSDAHLFTLGADWSFDTWTVSGALGYQLHEKRDKTNSLGDPVGSVLVGEPVSTANGSYSSDMYLVGVITSYSIHYTKLYEPSGISLTSIKTGL